MQVVITPRAWFKEIKPLLSDSTELTVLSCHPHCPVLSPSVPCHVTLTALSCHPHCPVMSPSLPCHVTPYCSALPPIVLYRLHSVTPYCNVSLAPYLTPYCTVSCAPYVSYHRVDELSSIFMLRRYFYFFTMRLLLLFLHCAIVTFISSLCDCHFYFFIVRLSLLFLHCAIVTFIFSLCDCRGPIHCSELKALAVVA